MSPTLCSSCLTSVTVPSLKLHFTISVSSLAPLTYSLLVIAVQLNLLLGSVCETRWRLSWTYNFEKSWSLM